MIYKYISFLGAIFLKKKDIHSLLRTISISSQMNNRGNIYKCDTHNLVDDRTYRAFTDRYAALGPIFHGIIRNKQRFLVPGDARVLLYYGGGSKVAMAEIRSAKGHTVSTNKA